MPLPPWSEVWDALRFLIAPALIASFLVMLAVRLLAGERFSVLASAFALAAGVVAGNYWSETIQWRVDSDRPLNERDMRTAVGWSLEGKPPAEPDEGEQKKDEPSRVPSGHCWLPWLAGLAILVDLLARLVPRASGAGWAARTLVAVLAGRLLTLHTSARGSAVGNLGKLGLAILLESGHPPRAGHAAGRTELSRRSFRSALSPPVSLFCTGIRRV